MSVSIRSGYITKKNYLSAKKNIEKGLLKAAGVTASGDVVLEIVSESTRKISIAAIDNEGKVATHFCSAVKRMPAEGSSEQGICWHLAALLMALAAAKGEDPPSLPYPIEVVTTFPENPLVVLDLTPQITGKPGEFNKCQFMTIEIPDNNEAGEDGTREKSDHIFTMLPEEDLWLKDLNLPPAVLKKILKFRESQRIDLTEEQYNRVPKNVKYFPQDKELIRAVSALMYGPDGVNWEPVLLRGPKGTGKSTLVEKVAEILMLPVNRISGSQDHDLDALLGGKTLKNGEIVYEEGLLLRAVTGGELLVLDEVNMMRQDITSTVHPLLEHRNRSLAVPGLGYITPPPTFRAIACMNIGYVGTSPLNEAFQDRFRSINVPYAKTEAIADIIVAESGCNKKVALRLARVFEELRNRVNSDDPIEEDVLSMRNLIRAAKESVDNPKDEVEIATSNISEGIDDEYTRNIVADVVATIYGERV
ncbi:MAG: AAA family ATPase [Dethiobacteraceae bacterium]